jgi:hypothetical protein
VDLGGIENRQVGNQQIRTAHSRNCGIEAVKLSSARFAEFLYWILYFQIGLPANVLGRHFWAPVRFNDLADCFFRHLDDLIGGV